MTTEEMIKELRERFHYSEVYLTHLEEKHIQAELEMARYEVENSANVTHYEAQINPGRTVDRYGKVTVIPKWELIYCYGFNNDEISKMKDSEILELWRKVTKEDEPEQATMDKDAKKELEKKLKDFAKGLKNS